MKTDNNDMDKKLRQLENQSLPDLSKQDAHWQQLQPMLQPGLIPAKPAKDPLRKVGPWLIAASVISILSYVGYYLLQRDSTEKTTKITGSTPKNLSDNNIADTVTAVHITKEKDAVRLTASKSKKTGAPLQLKAGTQDDRDTTKLVVPVSGQPVISKKESQTLAGFFKQLEKGTQEFVITPEKDTVISGADGTTLLIAANTFNSKKPVTILLKEYYSYEDIITNKLTTSSDGKQLITGGMIHILAVADGKEVVINPGKSIRWFVPDTSAELKQMKLFTAAITGSKTIKEETFTLSEPSFATAGRDTTVATQRLESINWIPGEQYFAATYLVTIVKVLDLKNNPYRARETKNGTIGKFHISAKPKISRQQLAEELKAKYGYYKVIIRDMPDDRHRRRWKVKLSGSALSEFWSAHDDVGDSAWVSPQVAAYFKLKATDTQTYTQTGFSYAAGTYAKKTFTNVNLNALANRFSVDIRTLGWINCDRFYNDNRPKVDYYVNINDTAANYYTVLVFDKIKSMVRGAVSGNKVLFTGVPEGISAKIICIGIQNGKSVAAMERLPAFGTTIENLKFEETTPTAFKEQAAIMDK